MRQRIRAYLAWERETIDAVRSLIETRNREVLRWLLALMAATYLGLLALSLFVPAYAMFWKLYLLVLGYISLCLFLVRRTEDAPVGVMVYGIFAVTVLQSLYASAFLSPAYTNIQGGVCIMLFPMLFFDASLRIDLVTLVLTGVYVGIISQFKVGGALLCERVNVLCFAMLGIVLGHYTRWRALRALLDVQQSQRQKAHDMRMALPNRFSLLQDLAARPLPPQALVVLEIREMTRPVVAFGVAFPTSELRRLGETMAQAAAERDITLYRCGQQLVGVAERRGDIALFQRLEPLYNAAQAFLFRTESGKEVPLHFGIGAADWAENVDDTLVLAAKAAVLACADDANRIILAQDLLGQRVGANELFTKPRHDTGESD